MFHLNFLSQQAYNSQKHEILEKLLQAQLTLDFQPLEQKMLAKSRNNFWKLSHKSFGNICQTIQVFQTLGPLRDNLLYYRQRFCYPGNRCRALIAFRALLLFAPNYALQARYYTKPGFHSITVCIPLFLFQSPSHIYFLTYHTF